MKLSSQQRTSLLSLTSQDCPSWMAQNFIVPDARDPTTGDDLGADYIRLLDHQKRVIRVGLARYPDGTFQWVTFIYSAIKKSGKTRLVAGIVSWYAQAYGPYNEIYCMANDGKQSSDRLLSAVKQSIQLAQRPEFESSMADWKVTKTRVELPDGTFIEAIPCDASGQAGANPGLTAWCLDARTEVLTHDGWKTYDTMRSSDLVATRTPDGSLEYQNMHGIYIDVYVGEMLELKNRSVDLLVTPGHRIVHTGGIGTAEELYGQQLEIPTAANDYDGVMPGERVSIPGSPRKPPLVVDTELWVRFMAWHLSEGYARKDGVIIAQSREHNPESFEAIVELVTAMGFDPVLEPKNDPHRITIYDSRLRNHLQQFGLSGDKYVPAWIKNLPVSLLQMFLDTYIEGDGYERQSGYSITTKSRRMASDLQEIALKLGMYTSINEGSFDCHEVYISKRSSSQTVGALDWHKRQYEGIVWCPSTSNGVIMVRRNGRVAWTGNSEMWGYREKHKERLWSEMTIPPTRWGKALRIVESYAGFTGESLTLQNLYRTGVKRGARHPHFPDIPVFYNAAAKMLAYWDHEPRMPWQTPDYYAQEAAVLVPSEFDRMHRNQWVDPVNKLIPSEWWEQCQDVVRDGVPLSPLDDTVPAVLGVDASVSHDSVAAVIITRHPERPQTDSAIRLCRVWYPPKGGKIDLTDTLEKWIREVFKRYNIVKLVYDEYQLHKLVTDLRKDIGIYAASFSQSTGRTTADKMLFDMIVSRQIVHTGDPELNKHINNVHGKTSGTGIRFVKPDTSTEHGITINPIDGAVAASMANFECMRLNLG